MTDKDTTQLETLLLNIEGAITDDLSAHYGTMVRVTKADALALRAALKELLPDAAKRKPH